MFEERYMMKVSNSVIPNREQIQGFFEPGPEGPIYMVNLLKFKPEAEYEDRRASSLTGREAYELYQKGVKALLPEFGGYGAFFGNVERLMLGEVEELWDVVGIAVYPSRQAMMDMMQSEKYKEISPHRSAGLAGQLNIETVGAYGDWLDAIAS
jgi:uncharacterized protein (DUF1330 family)